MFFESLINIAKKCDIIYNDAVQPLPPPRRPIIRRPRRNLIEPEGEEIDFTPTLNVPYLNRVVIDKEGIEKDEREIIRKDTLILRCNPKLSNTEIQEINLVTPPLNLDKCVNIKYWHAHGLTAEEIGKKGQHETHPVGYKIRRIKDVITAINLAK
jgi:hypothetical protein